MRKFFVLAALVLCTAALCQAQKSDSFDIATFQPPAAWKKSVKEGVVMFNTANEKSGSFALLMLYRSAPGSGDPTGDFNADWREFVAGQLGVKVPPQTEAPRSAGGWTVTTGGATFQNELGASLVTLTTFSGFGTKFSFSAIFNRVDYVPELEAFMKSIDLKPVTPVPSAANTAPPSANANILGSWGSNVGATMTYGDPVAAGMAGYTKSQYTLNADGTYVFNSKTFRMSYDKIILVRESGTYQINGGNLAIKPQKSVIQAWSKANGADQFGRLLTTQNRKLEPVTYRFTKHYFSGIDQWQLILQADAPTERDGPFSTYTLFSNAWYYGTISPNNPLIELPR